MRLLRPGRKKSQRSKTPNNSTRLVVGLRNPGPDYHQTRHNVGYEVVTEVVRRHGDNWGKAPSRVRAQVVTAGSGDSKVMYLAPTTFMNESGVAVRAALAYYQLDLDKLLVVHDDIDLAFGRLRLRTGGGSGGHNGIRSIERSLGSNEFDRLKIGVGRPPGSMDPADYVLRPFAKSERPEVDLMVSDAADAVEAWHLDPKLAQEMAARRDKD